MYDKFDCGEINNNRLQPEPESSESESSDDETSDSESDSEDAEPKAESSSRRKSSVGAVKIPPRNCEAFGDHGVMNGMAIGGTRVQRNPNKPVIRSARAYGHKSIRLGQWFPKMAVALYHGAHGMPGADVHGNGIAGVFSVLVSGKYEEIDDDQGDVLFYSCPTNFDDKDDDASDEKAKTGT
jgi:hypothetical protein